MTCHICAKTNCIGECEPKIKPAPATELREQEPVALKVDRGELCYKSQEDDQSFGMWCPITPNSDLPFSDGTKFYTTPPPQRKPLTDEQAKQASEAIEQIMEHAQVFASAWSLVGGRFDLGNAMEDAAQAKIELRTMVVSLAREAAHNIKEQP